MDGETAMFKFFKVRAAIGREYWQLLNGALNVVSQHDIVTGGHDAVAAVESKTLTLRQVRKLERQEKKAAKAKMVAIRKGIRTEYTACTAPKSVTAPVAEPRQAAPVAA